MPYYRRLTQRKPSEFPPQDSLQDKIKNNFSLILILVFVFVMLGLTKYVMHKLDYVSKPAPGILVSEEPQEQLFSDLKSFVVSGYSIKPVASYSIRARVIAVKHYTDDYFSAISPAEFLLGWGGMSDTAILDQVKFRMSGHSVYWRYEETFPANKRQLFTKNMVLARVIPADQDVARIMMKVRQNNIIHMSGYLVNLESIKGNWSVQNKNMVKTFLVENIEIDSLP